MAYFTNNKKDQEQNQPQVGAETVTSQGSTGASGGGTGGRKPASVKGTGFVGIGAYRALNKPDASNMSREIADDATSKAPDVGGFLRKSGEQVKGPSYTGEDIEAVRRGESQGRFSDWFKENYQGKGAASEYEGYGDVQSGVERLGDQAEMTKTSAGRQQLLRGIRDGGYTGGEAKFDSALMSSSDGLSELDRIINKSEAIKGEWQQGLDALNQKIQDTRQAYQDQRSKLAEAGQGWLGDLSGRITSAAANAAAHNQRQDADAQYIVDALRGEYGNNAMNLQLDKLGVDPSMYGAIGSWLAQNPELAAQLVQRSDFRADTADFLSDSDLSGMSEAQEIAALLGQDFGGIGGTKDDLSAPGYVFDDAIADLIRNAISTSQPQDPSRPPAPVMDGAPEVDAGEIIELDVSGAGDPVTGDPLAGWTEEDLKALAASPGYGLNRG